MITYNDRENISLDFQGVIDGVTKLPPSKAVADRTIIVKRESDGRNVAYIMINRKWRQLSTLDNIRTYSIEDSTPNTGFIGEMVWNRIEKELYIAKENENGLYWEKFAKTYQTDTSDPSTAPNYIGELFFNSNSETWFIAVDTAASSDWLALTTEAQTGSGSPVASVTPRYLGDTYIETTNDVVYIANGATVNDWVVAGYPTRTSAGTPVGSLTCIFFGEIVADTTNDDFYISYASSGNTSWKIIT